jgi:hypothetical protein
VVTLVARGGGPEQGEVSAVKVGDVLEARGEEVRGGELGPNAGAAALHRSKCSSQLARY